MVGLTKFRCIVRIFKRLLSKAQEGVDTVRQGVDSMQGKERASANATRRSHESTDFDSVRKGGEIVIEPAPEPDEVLWANLQVRLPR